ncbi:hypothetical protein B296_00036873, partial [Ensete ventricosum]
VDLFGFSSVAELLRLLREQEEIEYCRICYTMLAIAYCCSSEDDEDGAKVATDDPIG